MTDFIHMWQPTPLVRRAVRALRGLRLFAAVAVAVAGCGVAASASAHDEALARIVKSGRIVLGAHDVGYPATYLGPDGSYIGYHMEICQRVVTELRKRLGLPALKIVTVPVTMATRIALLSNGTVDMDCGPNPITSSSLRLALYAHATLSDESMLMSTTDKPRYRIADLENKTIGLTVGGSAAAFFRSATRSQNFKVNEVFGRNGRDLFGMLAEGRVDVISGAAPLLMAARALSPDPGHFVLLDISLGRVYRGLMFGLGDETLRAVANEVIESLARTGELKRLYVQWFEKDTIPGFARPIALPASAAQAAIFAEPGSEMQSL